MTIPEVNRYITAWGKRREQKRVETNHYIYLLPKLINSAIMGKYPEYEKVFELTEQEKEKAEKQKIEKFRQGIIAFSNNYNQKRQSNG